MIFYNNFQSVQTVFWWSNVWVKECNVLYPNNISPLMMIIHIIYLCVVTRSDQLTKSQQPDHLVLVTNDHLITYCGRTFNFRHASHWLMSIIAQILEKCWKCCKLSNISATRPPRRLVFMSKLPSNYISPTLEKWNPLVSLFPFVSVRLSVRPSPPPCVHLFVTNMPTVLISTN